MAAIYGYARVRTSEQDLTVQRETLLLGKSVIGGRRGLGRSAPDKRNKLAALKLMRKLLNKTGFVPAKLVTDELASYGAATRALGLADRHEVAARAPEKHARTCPKGWLASQGRK